MTREALTGIQGCSLVDDFARGAIGATFGEVMALAGTADFYRAIIPSGNMVTTAESLGKVSGWGWSWGYVGGLVALGLCLAWIMTAASRDQSTSEAVPATNLITAVIYLLGACVTFAMLRERAVPVPKQKVEFRAFARLAHTAR